MNNLQEPEFNIYLFLHDLQKLPARAVVSEIMTSGLTDEEIKTCLLEITFNDTWKYESLLEPILN